jgi:hypothetical protein
MRLSSLQSAFESRAFNEIIKTVTKVRSEKDADRHRQTKGRMLGKSKEIAVSAAVRLIAES